MANYIQRVKIIRILHVPKVFMRDHHTVISSIPSEVNQISFM